MIPLRDDVVARHAPVVTYALIVANLAVFAWEWWLPADALEALVADFGLVPARVTDLGRRLAEWPAALATFVTSAFLHGGLLHVVMNLWMLFLFGDNVEDVMGPLRFLAFYLVCGVLAGAAHVAVAPDSPVPTVGASGAIAGVMGAYFILYPGARMLVLVPVFVFPLFFEVPAFLFLGLWFLMQWTSGTGALLSGEATGIAFFAHIGGFVAGALAFSWFRQPGRGLGARS